jgi:hypothetical protein
MFLTLLLALNVHAACEWSEQEVGALPVRALPEASGVVFSRAIPGRLYHVNDSSNQPVIYWTDTAGNLQGQARVETPASDIGDNDHRRRSVRLILVPEARLDAPQVTPVQVKELVYPDGPHNAESLSVHPRTGDVFILTKDTKHGRGISKMYRLRASEVLTAGPATLEPWGQLDVSALADGGARGQLVTGMAFHPTGEHLFVLTYKSIVVVSADLSRPLGTNGNSEVLRSRKLPKQEAIAATLDGRGFVITTEVENGGRSPILQFRCL